jgi:hypothetical protein
MVKGTDAEGWKRKKNERYEEEEYTWISEEEEEKNDSEKERFLASPPRAFGWEVQLNFGRLLHLRRN